ncbi:MAG: PAS domain-containing protein [Myxococcales bacterium]|nr:PAS domain-containing protein [Myxococcales bacterium]
MDLSPIDPATPEPSKVPALEHLVVGVGASAGGLQALQELFEQLPSTSGVSFVVVQHLSPDFKSMMAQLLGRRASMVVRDAEHGERPEPDTVYLLPPKQDIELREGVLCLRERDPEARLHMPIDLFFHSLAMDQGDRCAAVVLSGTGSDGSRGLVTVRQAGGLVLAQSADSATFDGMPLAALATGLVDFVGTPGQIAQTLMRGSSPEPGSDVTASEPALQELIRAFTKATGIDLSKYKDSTVRRRIQRRIQITGQGSLPEYLSFTASKPVELRQLRLEMLIGVSSFFRDAEAWTYLRSEVLPTLLRECGERPMRAWVTACSTGEEAYSLAILLHEAFREASEPADYKLFATDVSEEAVRQASEGVYTEKAVSGIEPVLLNRYFEPVDTGYRVKRTIRERITFAVHNLMVDAPFTRLAFVSCRNMLIYLKPEPQKQVMSRICFGLVPSGVLFLGASETMGDLSTDFEVRSNQHKVYERHGGASRARLPTPSLPKPRPRPVSQRGPMEDMYRSVLGRFVPPGVATDARFEIVHVFGDVQPYITLPQGRMSTNLTRMLPPAASVLVTSAARRAREEPDGVVVTGVALGKGEAGDIRVFAVDRSEQEDHGFLVFFDQAKRPASDVGMDLDEASSDRLRQLEAELGVTRQHLQTAVQDLEASNEELQATNEELVASNEELQSTNEELQSVNEELYTVNAEYQAKIQQLEELSNDLADLLRSINMGAVFLDHELTIRRYNEVATRVVPLVSHDLGRHLRDLRWRIDYADLEADATMVLGGGPATVRTATDEAGTLWEVSILRHQHDVGPVGLLMILADVTAAKTYERKLADQAALHDAAAQLAKVGVAVLDLESRTVEISAASKVVLGVEPHVMLDYETLETMLRRSSDEAAGTSLVRTFETTRSSTRLRVSARPGTRERTMVIAFQPIDDAL